MRSRSCDGLAVLRGAAVVTTPLVRDLLFSCHMHPSVILLSLKLSTATARPVDDDDGDDGEEDELAL